MVLTTSSISSLWIFFLFALTCFYFYCDGVNSTEGHNNTQEQILISNEYKRNLIQQVSLSSNSVRDKEIYLIEQEKINFANIANEIKFDGISIRGFYHVSNWRKFWKNVITEQMMIMDGKRKNPGSESVGFDWSDNDGVSLLNVVDELFVNQAVLGFEGRTPEEVESFIHSLHIRSKDKIKMHHTITLRRQGFGGSNETFKQYLLNNSQISEGEISTINAMHSYCTKQTNLGKRAYVFYAHSKGECCWNSMRDPVRAWRDEMNAFTLEFPSICLRALHRGGYSACGTDIRYAPAAHYSGNMWWTSCNHIAALSHMQRRFDPWDAEYFIFSILSPLPDDATFLKESFANQCGYSPVNTNIPRLDLQPVLRSKYRDRLIEHLESNHYLASSVSGKFGNNDTTICKELAVIGNYSDPKVLIKLETYFPTPKSRL
eukprot:gene12314-16517_t